MLLAYAKLETGVNTLIKTEPDFSPAATDERHGLRRPRQKRSEKSLDRLLKAVEVLVSTKGLESLTLADLLRNSGVSNGTFYARFPSKDALVYELQDRVLARLEASLSRECAALRDREIPLQQAVSRLTRALAEQFRDNAGLLASLMRNDDRDATMQRRAAKAHATIEQLFVETLAPRMPSASRSHRSIAMVHTVLSAVLIERVSADQSAAAKHSGDQPSVAVLRCPKSS